MYLKRCCFDHYYDQLFCRYMTINAWLKLYFKLINYIEIHIMDFYDTINMYMKFCCNYNAL